MNTSAMPVAFRVAVAREKDGSVYDPIGVCYRDKHSGSVVSMCTHITDPHKKEWDD